MEDHLSLGGLVSEAGLRDVGEDAVGGAAEDLAADDSGERLDVFLARRLGVTRSFARRLIREGRVSCGGARPKPALKVSEGVVYRVETPPPEDLEIEPEPVDFRIVYEDDALLVVDKPAGLVVHPAPGHWRGTLVHGLMWRYPDMGPFNNVKRPGIVHRLDATTSGLMIVACRQGAMEALQEQFRDRSVEKEYLALVRGRLASADSSTATTAAPVLLAAPSDADFPRQTPADTASPAASSMVTASCIWDHASRWSLDPLLLLSILMQEGIEPGQCAVNRNGTCDMGPSGINNRPAALQELSRYMNEPHENFEQRLLSDACFNVGAGAAMLHMKIRQAGGDTWKGVAHYNSRTPHIGQAYARKVARHYKRIESYMLETVATSSQ